MPQSTPGGLSASIYTDLVTFILARHGYPARDAGLPPEENLIRGIVIEAELLSSPWPHIGDSHAVASAAWPVDPQRPAVSARARERSLVRPRHGDRASRDGLAASGSR